MGSCKTTSRSSLISISFLLQLTGNKLQQRPSIGRFFASAFTCEPIGREGGGSLCHSEGV